MRKWERAVTVASILAASVGVTVIAVRTAPPARAQEGKAQVVADSLRLTPGQPLAIFAPGTEVRFTIEPLKRPEADSGTLSWEARDLDDRILAKGEGKLTGSPDPIRFTPRDLGIVYIRAELKDASGAVMAKGESRAAIFTPREKPVPASPVLWAVASHLHGLSPRDATREIEIMRQTGFAACRFDLVWSGIQPEQSVYKWDVYDRLFAEFARNGVLPLPLIGYGTKWATTGNPNAKDWHEWNNTPPRTEAYTGFAQKLVERYGKYTPYWEVWNEPDIAFWLGTVEQYAELSNATVRAIHAADPKAKVMNGGFSETKRRPDFIPRYLSLATTRPDIYAFHSHGPLPNLIRAAEESHTNLKAAGWTGVPLWLNEAGFSSTRGATERQQAMTLVKKMSFAPSVGVTGYVWYDLRNDGVDPNENEHNFGLLRNDFSPKASLVAAHTTMEALSGKRFLRRLDLGSGQYALLYARDGEQTLVYWSEAGSADSQESRLLRTSATTASYRNMMGVERSAPIKSGLLTTVFTHEPQFLVLKGRNIDLTPTSAALDAPANLVAAPNSRTTVTVTLTNPLASAPLKGELILTAPAGWRVSPERTPVTLAVGEVKKLSVEVVAPAAPTAGALRLRLTSSVLPQPAEVAAAVLPARVVPKLSADVRGDLAIALPPIATLSGQESTVSLFEATPMRELHFAGPEDMSAQVYLSHDAHNILLGVRVRDNQHVQRESGDELWKGDSIQFALITPGGKHYEWTAALTETGPRLILGIAPEGTPRREQPADLLTIRRDGDITYYQVRIPDTLPGVREMLAQGGGINVLVNDNDGQGRKGWVEWAPGIGRTKDPARFPRVVFTEAIAGPTAR